MKRKNYFNKSSVQVTISYDKIHDLAYIYLADIPDGSTRMIRTTEITDEVGDMMIDIAKGGELFGIEILDASKRIPHLLANLK